MLTTIEQENLKKSIQNAQELARNLQQLSASENPLLADIALDLMPRSISVCRRLLRLASSVACSPETAA